MPKTILVVDDNPENRKLIQLFLRRFLPAGTIVHEAEDGDVGCDRARDVRPDLILMDIQMPRMDGLRAIELLREQAETRDIPVIILTANLSDEEIRRAQEAGALDIIPKPLELQSFISTVRAHLY